MRSGVSRIRGALLLTLSAVLVAGCQSAVDLQQQAASGSSTAACRPGGTLVVANAQPPIPGRILAQGAANLFWVRGVFETLLAVKNGDVKNPEPLLASAWKLGADDRSAVLTLRQGVTFHSGRPFTAADVLYTFEQALTPASPSIDKQIIGGWQIEATGDHEVTIRSKTALSPVLASVLDDTPIVDSETYAGLADGSKIIGTGPFKVEEYQPGSQIVLVRNDKYWQQGLPHLDRIENVVIPDSTAQLAALRSSRAQLAGGLTTQDAQTVTRQGDQFQLQNTLQAAYSLVLDTTSGVFADKTVRQAVGYAIDRDRIKQQVFGGLGTTAGLIWPPGDTYPKDLENTYRYDPAKARQLIQQAGATGAAVPITIINNPQLQAEYQIIANNLTDVGLKPNLVALAAPDYQARLAAQKGGNYLSFRGVADTPSLIAQTNPDVRLQGAHRQFGSPEYTALVQGLVEAGSGPDAAKAVHELTAYMLDQAVQHVVVTTPGIMVRSTAVGGTTFTSGGLLSRETCLVR
ncbi:ABC transporter substrate-binding protein [Amycolatopsis sp. ATCC 39116]|uniref:ABC transporter substrate-binding protein n=1 Tax=Amycolatopsis sp. (strain ATCC 39116 / 75iv2) TaxID=385957 RepID=UPI0002E9EDC3|nr:ABC transporter substrate-binding protein [Amycolatopsis sp. ATCC 39116]